MPGRVISFCLYGDAAMYLRGMVANARLAPAVMPGWTVRVHCDDDVDARELESLGCEIRRMGRSRGHSGMLWRLLPAWQPDVERVVFRDADSRLNVRGAAAVREWEESGFAAHAMLDHPNHESYLVMGGMWGVLGGVLPDWLLTRFTEIYRGYDAKGFDSRALTREVFPLVRESLVLHASIRPLLAGRLASPARPFPPHPPFEGFVGQQVDDAGRPLWAGQPPAVRTGGEPS